MRRPLLALCTLLLVSSIALPITASPQPSPICGPCGGGFEDAAAREDIDLTVTGSTAVVRVHDDGRATWRITNRLRNDSAAAYLRNHSQVLDAIVDYAIRRSAVEGPIDNESAHLEGNTVVISFEDRYATTEMPGGVQLLGYFHSRGYESWYVVTADRLTVLGPEDTMVTNDPPGATVRGRNATWYGNASARVWDAPTLEQDAYVAFAEPSAAASTLTALAIALATLPIVVDVLVSTHLPPLLLFGLLLAGVGAGTRRAAPQISDPRKPAAVVGLGGVVATFVLVAGIGEAGMAAGFAAVSLAMAAVTFARGDDVRIRELVGAAALALAVTALGGFLTVSAGSTTQPRSVYTVAGTLRSLPFVVVPAFGAALADEGMRRRAVAWAVTLVAVLTAELATLPPTQRPFGVVIVLLGAYAVAVAALSIPFVLLGTAAESPR